MDKKIFMYACCSHYAFPTVGFRFNRNFSLDRILDEAQLLYHERFGVIPDKVVLQINYKFIWKKLKLF